jgi:hypothetical protein
MFSIGRVVFDGHAPTATRLVNVGSSAASEMKRKPPTAGYGSAEPSASQVKKPDVRRSTRSSLLCVRLRLLLTLCVLTLSSPGPAAAVTRLPGIRSPSGNITCLNVPGRPAVLRCEIAHSNYAQTLQNRCMSGPSVDWHGFELSATGKGLVTCSGGILYNPDTERPSYVTLPYGKTWRRGAFTCSSRVTGVTCQNWNGHGLFLSRQAWRAW